MTALRTVTATALYCALFGFALFGWWWMADNAGWLDPQPPSAWRATADSSDILSVDDRKIAYWGKPDARYSSYATRGQKPPVAVVVHFNYPKSMFALVRYGHKSDPARGNASFGYHVYIDRKGHIVQGAPLSVRTNHIKSSRRPERTGTARHLWSGNTIGVSLVGACDPVRSPVWQTIADLGLAGSWTGWRGIARCARETPTPAQLAAGAAVVRALQARYSLECREVFGHGELQTDRDHFEGETLSRLIRSSCPTESS